MAVDLHPDIVRAIRRFSHTDLGRKYDRYTRRKYHLPGWKVEAKTIAGEFGGRSTRSGRGVVSSAGARGPAQFIPGTRKDFIDSYGIDPWKNDKSAVKSLALHQMTRGGIAGYNPGMPTYQNYILGQQLNPSDRRALRGGSAQPTPGGGLTLRGPTHTTVGLNSYKIPGQSFEGERRDARRELLLGGDINLHKLLEYKAKVNQFQDIPSRTVRGDLTVQRSGGRKLKFATAAGVRGTQGGRISLAPGANRSGAHLAPELRQAVKHLSAVAGRPLVIGTGTNHSRMTVNGNVSDHWDGHGADIPETGAALTKLGRQALIAFGMPARKARKVNGGLFNLDYHGHRVQVIFQTQEGGDHTTHLYLGFR